jgi:cytochrome c-type biogenesis protein CcmH/NrfF
MKRIGQILVFCCLPLLLMGSDSSRFEKLGGKLICTCSCGEMLLKCDHVGCRNSATMIRQLRAQVATGKSDDEILNFFRQEWGVTAVSEPRHHGFELLVWVMPFAALALGGVLVILIVRKWQRRAALAGGQAGVALDPHLEALRARARQETEI